MSKCQYFSLSDVQKWSVFLTYHVICHKSFLLEEIQLSVNCYVSIFNFNSPKYQKHSSSLQFQHFGGKSQGSLKNVPGCRRFSIRPGSENK